MSDLTDRLRNSDGFKAITLLSGVEGFGGETELMAEAADRIDEVEEDLAEVNGWNDALERRVRNGNARIDEVETENDELHNDVVRLLKRGPADYGMVPIAGWAFDGSEGRLWREATE